MLHTKPITKEMNDFSLIEDLYYTAFPKREQVPMGILLSRTKNKDIRFEAYYDGNVFVGFTYVITNKDLTYLFYFATSAEVRGEGYGTQILSHFKASYPNQRLVLNCLAEDENAADNDMRKRRQNFYLRNDYIYAGFSCKMNGNHVIAFTQSDTITTEEFSAVFKKFWGPIWFILFKPKIEEKQSF